MNVFVRDLHSNIERRLTSETDRDIPSVAWKGNNTILYVRDFGGDENYHVFGVSVDGGDGRDLTPYPGVRAQIIDDLEEQSDTDILVSMNRRNARMFDVYRLNVETGASTMIAENPGTIDHWLTDHDGRLRVAVATDGVESTLMYRDEESEPFRAVVTTDFRDALVPLVFTADNCDLIAASNIGRDRAALIVFDLGEARERTMLYEHPDVDVDGVEYSKRQKKIVAAHFTLDRRGYHVFDEAWGTIRRRLDQLLPNGEVAVVDKDDEEKLLIVRVTSDRSFGAYYLYDVERDELNKLADLSPWLDEENLAVMAPVTYASRDGLTIHGYLTLPPGSNAHMLPAIVNPHGGPWARDTWGFRQDVQFLANRGYAVLQMNFRGSVGYGKAFMQASFKQWGRAMQDDISDGVAWLIEQGIADPKRVAIYGASYGGYATLAGVTFTPELYACGIDYVGVSNLFTFMETIPPYWESFRQIMYEMVGHPEEDAEQLRATSPVFHVDRIVAPLLVLQGRNDPRVNVAESLQIVEALRARGVDVEYIENKEEGHGFHNEENRIEVFRAIEGFLERHLGGCS